MKKGKLEVRSGKESGEDFFLLWDVGDAEEAVNGEVFVDQRPMDAVA